MALSFPAWITMTEPAIDVEEDNLTWIVVNHFKQREAHARLIVRHALWLERDNPDVEWPKATDVLAVIAVESAFTTDAIHPIGPSVGLMQINAGAHRVSVSELKQIGPNIKRGYDLLTYLRAKTSSDSKALIAYNAGLGKLKKICGDKKICVTGYVQKVLKTKAKLEK